jgi:hypothetical protein
MATFAVVLPILLLFVMMVVEFGNFYEHRRHLQFQADAGALAGAGLFNHCFTDDAGNLAIANGAITDQARLYSGAYVSALNEQVGNATARITARINKKEYEVGGPPADDTVESEPCAAGMLDVKMTEADLPFVLRGIASLFGSVFGDKDVDSINARARIEIQELNVLGNSLPLAVPDPNPRLVAITLINEINGNILGTADLVNSGVSGTVRQWRNADPIPITVPAAGARIGIRVQLGGETSTTCGDDLVDCKSGLAFIHGTGTSTGAPILTAVWPTTASCLSPSFMYQHPSSCSVGVAATLAFGPGVPNPSVAQVSILVNNNALPGGAGVMAYSGGVWSTAPGAFTPPAFGGPYNVSVKWEVKVAGLNVNGTVCTSTGSNPCKGTFANVQRFFSGSLDQSGSVRTITVTEPGSTATGSPYSLAPGDHELNVAVGTYFFQAVDADSAGTDETVVLRAAGSGSNNYAIDCGWSNLRERIEKGCQFAYQRNPRVPGCSPPAAVTPADCVNTEPGGAIGQLTQGMNNRFGCPTNRWGTFPIDPTDSRIVPMMLTDFGSAIASGRHLVAVRRFSAFYVTGWDGATCSANEPYPFSGSSAGNVWGHFIHNVSTINNGGGDPSALCNFDPLSLDACIAVMTR